MKKVSLPIGRIPDILSGYLKRFHVMIYTLTVVIGVSVAMFMLNSLVFQQDTPDEPPASTTTPAFDQDTIERINNFNTSSSGDDNFSLPPGRVNPLVD